MKRKSPDLTVSDIVSVVAVSEVDAGGDVAEVVSSGRRVDVSEIPGVAVGVSLSEVRVGVFGGVNFIAVNVAEVVGGRRVSVGGRGGAGGKGSIVVVNTVLVGVLIGSLIAAG